MRRPQRTHADPGPPREPSMSNPVQEFLQFLREHKRYVLVPLVLVIAFVVALVWLARTGGSPFGYELN